MTSPCTPTLPREQDVLCSGDLHPSKVLGNLPQRLLLPWPCCVTSVLDCEQRFSQWSALSSSRGD